MYMFLFSRACGRVKHGYDEEKVMKMKMRMMVKMSEASLTMFDD